MSKAEAIAECIRQKLQHIKAGTPRFWGEWFGRPYDNQHRLVRCAAEKDSLLLYFNEQEKLSIWSPGGLEISLSKFAILDADRVRMEWFAYGRPKIVSNLYHMDFQRSAGGIVATTNIDWFTPNFAPSPDQPAVAIL
jgi:hypothetical protein